MDLTGFQLEPLHDDGELLLCRALRPGTAVSVLALVATRPASQSITRLEQEYALASTLDAAWAAQPLALDLCRVPPMLILDDDGGDPLIRMLGRPLEFTRFLRIAVNLARAVSHVARNRTSLRRLAGRGSLARRRPAAQPHGQLRLARDEWRTFLVERELPDLRL